MVAIPDPSTFRVLTDGLTGRMICDVVTPDGNPYDGDPRHVLRRALERMEAMGFDTFNVGPGGRVLPLQGREGHRDARRRWLFRPDDDGRRDDDPPRHDPRARGDGDPGRVPPPRGRPVAARDRHPLHERARHGGLHAHVPPRREGGRKVARLPRDVHAEAALRRERLRHAHASVALQGRPQPVLRRERQVASLRRREGLHRRPAPPRAGDLGRLRAVGQLVQAARAGLRGAGLRRVVDAQPLGADPDPALQAGLGAGDPGGAPLPRSCLQPVSDVRVPAARRPRRDRARATSCRIRWRRTSTT